MTKPSSSVPTLEPTDSPIKGKRIRRALKRFIWDPIKGKPIRRALKRFIWDPIKETKIWQFLKRVIWGPENETSDKFWEKRAYPIIRSFGALGVAVLSVLVVRLFLPWDFLKTWEILKKEETARNIYYLLIFVGAALAATLGTWRGRQSDQQIRQSERQIRLFERQMQISRFEKALDMATDPTGRARRGTGFRILGQMLAAWRENSDDATKKNVDILHHLVNDNFMRTEKQEKIFRKLYEDSKTSFASDEDKSLKILYSKTQKPNISLAALNLWKEIVNWKRTRSGEPLFPGICATKSMDDTSHLFMFSGMNLEKLRFFVIENRGRIVTPTQGTMAGFKESCFLVIHMHGAIINYVNFSRSHFFKINHDEKNKKNCKMFCLGTIFNETNFIECNFRGAHFKDTSFVGTNSFRTNFDEASLINCNFRGADCKNTFFIETNILSTIFDEANLIACDFKGANFVKSNPCSFVKTNITGTNFTLANNLTKEQFLHGAYWVRQKNSQLTEEMKPKFPEGELDGFPPGFADTLPDRPPPNEKSKGQGEVKAEPLP